MLPFSLQQISQTQRSSTVSPLRPDTTDDGQTYVPTSNSKLRTPKCKQSASSNELPIQHLMHCFLLVASQHTTYVLHTTCSTDSIATTTFMLTVSFGCPCFTCIHMVGHFTLYCGVLHLRHGMCTKQVILTQWLPSNSKQPSTPTSCWPQKAGVVLS